MVSEQSDHVKAEILWALSCVMDNNSGRSNSNKGPLFKAMFPDSDIAARFTLGRSKYHYVMNFGIAEYIKDCLTDAIKASPYFSVSFDESLNEILQKCQMDVVIKYWDSKKNEAVSKYFSSTFLGHASAEHLKTAFLSLIDCFDHDRLIQISMDGPKVNILFYKKVVEFRSKENHKPFIDLGTCNLHVMHGALKTGVKSTGWGLKETLSSNYNLLHDSPARRDDYTAQTGSTDFPLPPCWTRWTEDVPVCTRLISIWPFIKKLIRYYEGFAPSKRPKCKSYEVLVQAVKDKLKVCQLYFYSFVAQKLEPFLTFYQSDKPLAPFMYGDLLKVIHDLMSLVFKDTSINEIKQLSDFRSMNLDDDKHILKRDQFTLGTGTSNNLKTLLSQDKITAMQAKAFKKNCKKFIIEVLKKLQERIPLSSMQLKCISFADTSLICSSPSVAKQRLKLLAEFLCSTDVISPHQADSVISSFNQIIKKPNMKTFCKKNDRLVHFYFNTLDVGKEHPLLANFLIIIFCLSHGQAPVERGFSHNKNALQTNLQEKSLISKRLIKDFLVSNQLQPHEVPLTPALMKQVGLARKQYAIDLKKTEDQIGKTKEKSQVQILNADIDKIRKEIDALEDEISTLCCESRKTTKRARDEKNFNLINIAVNMDEKANEKQCNVDKLKEALGVMLEKKEIICSS